MSNIRAVPNVLVLLGLLFFKVLGLAYVQMDSHVTTKIFEINELTNFLRYSTPLAGLQCAGALL